MDYKERCRRAITFQSPDHIPVTYSCLPIAILEHGQRLLDLFARYPNDFHPPSVVKMCTRQEQFYRPDGTYFRSETDEWGCYWEYYLEGIIGEVKRGPLTDWSRLKDWNPPGPQCATPEQKAAFRKEWTETLAGYPVWAGGSNYFERMQWLRGVEEFLCDIALDEPGVYELADRILYEHILPGLENIFSAGVPVDVVGFGDDWGSNRALLINPESFRRIFKPRYAKMFELCRKHGALTNMHSDGVTLDIIPDLIDIGLDQFNPQSSCQDLREIKKRTGDDLAILTDTNRYIIARGTPREIDDHVAELVKVFGGRKGGMTLNGNIEAGVPFENAQALLAALFKYREF